MNKQTFDFTVLAAAALLALAAGTSVAGTPSAQKIFDGRTLAGWEGNTTYWHVEDGAITGSIPEGQKLAHNEFIYWSQPVGDFELQLEFRLTGGPEANSGIQFRSQRLPDGAAVGYQADIDAGAFSLGQIYEERARGFLAKRGLHVSLTSDGQRTEKPLSDLPDFAHLFKVGGWNSYHVKAKGSHMELRVNGKLTVVLDDLQKDAAKAKGLIAFQLHAGPGPSKIQFRNIELTK